MMNVGNPELAFEFRAAAERGRRPRAARIHHQPQRRHPSEGAARARSPSRRRREARRSSGASRGYAGPTEFYVAKIAEGMATIAAAFCAEAGDRAAVRLQVERVLEPHRRRAVRAARGKPDARLSRRITLRRSEFHDCFALECEAMRRVRDDMGLTNVELMVPVRAHRARGGAGRRPARRRTGCERGENGLRIDHDVRDAVQRDARRSSSSSTSTAFRSARTT